MSHEDDTIPYGFCHCGCGQKTKPCYKTVTRTGWVKGEPMRFIKGHNNRLSPVEYIEEDRGYETPCWIWQRSIQPDGYGRTVTQTETGRKSIGAHVLLWERMHGPVPDGLEIDHRCRVRCCVNPSHLEPVTKTENVRRGNRCKLNVTLVAEIRVLRESGWTLIRLAEKFHVSIPVVSKICRYESWR